jgi:hypothetical protein
MKATENKILEPQTRSHTNGRGKSSRFAGVSWHRSRRVWVAFVILDGKQQHVGSFPPTRAGEIEAATLRDLAMLRLGRTSAQLNFPLT